VVLGLGARIFGGLITAGVAVAIYFLVAKPLIDKASKDNDTRQTAGTKQFARAVTALKHKLGPNGKLVAVTLRPSSAEFVTAVSGGTAHALRWTGGSQLQAFDENDNFTNLKPWPLEQLDPRAPKRIYDAISSREDGRFQLSIGDLQRADTGRLVWTMRGLIGSDRGVAYNADPDGSGVVHYDPTSTKLNNATRLTQCIHKAAGDPAKLQRCVARFKAP
jgi:hypothetical protein